MSSIPTLRRTTPPGASTHFLVGGGEMGDLIRAFDWSSTPLGSCEEWPQSLRSAVSILLPSKAQIALFWGPDLVTLYNDAYRPVFGGKHPSALGKPIRESWDELWRAGLRELFDGVLATGEAFWAKDLPFFMERHGYLEETFFDVSYDPVRDESGQVGGVFCIVSETTGRVLSERRMRALRELAHRTAEARSVEDALRLAALALRDNRHDLPFAWLYDADGAGASGAPAGTLWPLDQARDSGAPVVLNELPSGIPAAEGVWTEPVQQAVVLPIGPTGQASPHGFLVSGISPRLRLDAEYLGFLQLAAGQIGTSIGNALAYELERRRAEELAGIDRAKTAFFSNVSHEFRTPLALMLGPAEDALADREAPLDPVQRQRLEIVHRNGLRLQRLVNALLDFSRIEAGRARACFRPTDLAALTADLASSFRSATDKAGLALNVDCPPLPEPVFVDADLWEKIVLNLLSNAFKFTFEGAIDVTLRMAGERVELAVRDSGTGISAENLPRVFERFHRVEGARSRTHEGSGIGLALVQELVRLHGGTVAVDSVEGGGSTFTVSVPRGKAHIDPRSLGDSPGAERANATQPYVEEALSWLPHDVAAPADGRAAALAVEPEPLGAASGVEARRDRIIWADDNADMREYVQRLLAEHYDVEAFGDGEAALAAAKRARPDLVLADVMMPRLDGIGLLRRLREDPATCTLPVILLSARAGEEARIEGLDAGADAYIYKPFNSRELLAQVAARIEISRLQRRLEEERARLAELFLQTPVATAVLRGEELVFDRANPAYIEIIGGRSIVGLPLLEALPELRGQGFDDLLRGVMRTGIPHVGRETALQLQRHGSIDDAYVTFIYAPLRGADNRVEGVIAICQEVSEQVRAREAVRRNEIVLHEEAQALETLNRIGIVLAGELDLERAVQAVTDAATEVSGAEFGAFFYNVTNAAGESYMLYTISGVPREKFSKFPMPRNTAVFGPTFAGEGIVRVDDITKDPRYGKNAPRKGMPEGHLPVCSYLAVPVISRSGEVLGGLFFGHSKPGVFQQRAERLVSGIASQAAVAIDNARLYQQRLGLIEQLREEDRRKNEFLATLSHELRNPLAPLRNALEIMSLARSRGSPGPDVQPIMERQVNHLVRLVDDLMELSRINRGAFELRREPIDIATVVRNAIETSDPLIREAAHRISVTQPGEPLWVDGDAVRLAQVLANLLNNAAKYTDRGGSIAVATRREADHAVVSVRDNGVGIAPEAIPKLFEMFSRGERSSRRDQAGLGIGLALARKLAEMHGGTLDASSEGPGRGSEFTLRLPLVEPPTALHRGAVRDEQLPSRRILIVDDNRDAADSLAMLLGTLGATVHVARSGAEALESFAQHAPEVVLLDIGMPEMDGYEVARRLRADFADRRPTLVALTGWGQLSDRQKAEDAGFDRHLIKPAKLDELHRLLASLPEPRQSPSAA